MDVKVVEKKSIKRGTELQCTPCKSLILKNDVSGKVIFDSWEGEDKCFVSIPKQPSSVRYLVENKNLNIK